MVENEIVPGGGVETGLTILLRGPACPIGCTMCDLHRTALPHACGPGDVPAQIRSAIDGLPAGVSIPDLRFIKLYNGGNFLDAAAVPPVDYQTIASMVNPIGRVVFENHPRVGSRRLATVAGLLDRFEVAIGLESVQPGLLRRLNKRTTRDEIDRYAARVQHLGGTVRIFLIIGAPRLSIDESMRWAMLSVRHAVAIGASHVSLVPARTGHGWGGDAVRLPDVRPADALRLLRRLHRRHAGEPVAITVDTWDMDRGDPAVGEIEAVQGGKHQAGT